MDAVAVNNARKNRAKAAHANAKKTKGVCVEGTIQNCWEWKNGAKVERDIIWDLEVGTNKQPPRTVDISIDSIRGNKDNVKPIRNVDGDITAYQIRVAVTGITVGELGTDKRKNKMVGAYDCPVSEILEYHWKQIKEEGKIFDDKIHYIIDTCMGSDTPDVKTHVERTINMRSNETVEFFLFKEEERKAFTAVDESDNKPKIRENAKITMNNARPCYEISVYKDKHCTEEPSEENPYPGVRFKTLNFVFRPYEYEVTVQTRPGYEIMVNNIDPNKRLFVSYDDYLADPSSMPYITTIYTSSFGNWDSMTCKQLKPGDDGYDPFSRVDREMSICDDEKDFLYIQNPESEPKRQCAFKGNDWVRHFEDDEECYEWNVQCRSSKFGQGNPVDSIGIFDPIIFQKLMFASQPLPTFVSGTVMRQKVHDYWFSQLTPEERAADEYNTKAFWTFWCTKMVPHYEEIKNRFMFPISKEYYIELLSDTADEVEDEANEMFKEMTHRGKPIRSLTNFYAVNKNPLHKRGKLSHVINLGNASKPAFATGNLDKLLLGRELYVWASNNLVQPTDETNGDAQLSAFIDDDTVHYQIFAFKSDRAASEPSAKKIKAKE